MKPIQSIFKFPNDMVAVIDIDGEQVPHLQGEYSDKLHRALTILTADTPNVQWNGMGPMAEMKIKPYIAFRAGYAAGTGNSTSPFDERLWETFKGQYERS